MRRAFAALMSGLRGLRARISPPLTTEQAEILLRIKYPCC
jgi:hypothetical protein